MFWRRFYKIQITKEKQPVGVRQNSRGSLQHPFVHLNVETEFIIRKIEVYGYTYVCQSENIEPNPFYNIERENPGQAITERIETENILLLYSDNGSILIQTFGPAPWISVSYKNSLKDLLPLQKDNEGNTVIQLKHQFK